MTPQRFNVLLVDDRRTEARLFEIALADVAPRVTFYWVATSDEAIEALRRTGRFKDVLGFDIVVLDLNMPGKDGFVTLERIKGDPDLALKPVLMMSSSDDLGGIEKCYRLGANSYYLKPLTIEGMRELVRSLVRCWLEFAKLPPDVPTSGV